jgi:hypothetical protein
MLERLQQIRIYNLSMKIVWTSRSARRISTSTASISPTWMSRSSRTRLSCPQRSPLQRHRRNVRAASFALCLRGLGNRGRQRRQHAAGPRAWKGGFMRVPQRRIGATPPPTCALCPKTGMDEKGLRKGEALRRRLPDLAATIRRRGKQRAPTKRGSLDAPRCRCARAYKATGTKWQSRINSDLRKCDETGLTRAVRVRALHTAPRPDPTASPAAAITPISAAQGSRVPSPSPCRSPTGSSALR